MIDEEVSALLGLGAMVILAVATFWTWGRLARRKLKRSWPCVVLPIDESLKRPDRPRASRY